MECPVARAARESPDAPALSFRDQRWTWREVDEQVRRWHGALAHLRPGARVVVRSENRPDIVALLHACARAGVALCPLNARLAPAELPPLLERLSPDLLLGDLPGGAALDGFADRVPALQPGAVDESAVQTVLFTSGTTGRPKAAQLTVAAHLANARASVETLRMTGRSRYLATLPLYHVGGLAIAMRCALVGAETILHERFDAPACAEALGGGATHASLVATTLRRTLAERSSYPGAIVLVGGGPSSADLLQRARDAGLTVLMTYGLTEAASQVTAERIGEADGATAGTPLPGIEVRIDDGEILVRGATLMRGYLGEPPLRGWFRTGDLGELDARGRLVVHARRSDLIVSGGENVYPAEIEAALLAHPAVSDAAVVPWPDAEYGQIACAAIVGRATQRNLERHCRARLAAFKVPRRWVFLHELPRASSGKLDRVALLHSLRG
jgi:o-succinylbenzoate---CoA ligase